MGDGRVHRYHQIQVHHDRSRVGEIADARSQVHYGQRLLRLLRLFLTDAFLQAEEAHAGDVRERCQNGK